MSTRHPWWRSPTVTLAGAALVSTALCEVVLSRMRGSQSDFLTFVGRFHPLAVHLPIGLFVLVAVAELASLSPRLRPRIDPALGLVLPLTVVAAFGSFVLGHLLARDGGFAAHTLALHRRLEFVAVLGTALSLGAWGYQAYAESRSARGLYRLVLFSTFGVLSIGAHFGGTLSRGDTYLSKYAPGRLTPLLGGGPAPAAAPAPSAAPSAKAAQPLLFADVVQPILRRRCVECHGPDKVKGKLRLDSLEALNKGGENGPVIEPGDAHKSSLVQRMLLPVTDDDRMPPEGKPGPRPEEIAVIEFWIERGANPKLEVRDLLAPANARSLLEKALGGSAKEPLPTAAAEASAAPQPAASSSGEEPRPAATAVAPAHSVAEPRATSEPAAAPTAEPSVTPPASGPGDALSILADKCQKCHGPQKQKGKLRVDSLQALLRGGSDGPAVVPGDPSKSAIITRARLPVSDDDHMPPKKELQLSSAELAVLSAWVQRGIRPQRQASASAAAGAKGSAMPGTEQEPAAADAALDSGTAPAPGAAAEQPTKPASVAASTSSGNFALFTDAVEPLLLEKCGNCHAGAKPKGRFDVSTHEKLLAGGVSGPAVVAGDVQGSELMRRVLLPVSDDEHMPPLGEPALTSGDIELLKAWVELGASSDQRVDPATLPAGVQQALEEHRAKKAQAPAGEAVQPAAAGCAACTVGGRGSARDLIPISSAAAIGFSWLARFRRRRQSVSAR